MLRLFFLTCLLLPAFIAGVPLSCTEVSTTYTQTVYDSSKLKNHRVGNLAEIVSDSNFTYNARYNLFGDGNTSWISLYDVSGFDTTFNTKIKLLCYWFFSCHIDFSTPSYLPLLATDPFVRMDINFGNNETAFIDGFFYDNNTLTHWDGTIFNPNNTCVQDIYKDDGLFRNRTTCCTEFTPTFEPVMTTKYPKCKALKSRTTVYNKDFSIFATSSVNFAINGRQVSMTGDWDGQDTFGFEFANKFFLGQDASKKFAMNATVPAGNSKPFFTSIFVKNTVNYAVQDVIAFINDGDYTLMQAGTPYTKTNDCSYHSFPSLRGGLPLTASVQMCCTEFES